METQSVAGDEPRSEALKSDERWHLVQRIAASHFLQRSPRLTELLLHLCEHALLGHPERLTEQQIGCAVFGRQPGFSSADDTIVRVQVRQLRIRLEKYFQEAGSAEPVTLEIPKGSYVPHFVDNRVVDLPAPAEAPPWWCRWWPAAAWSVVAALSATGMWMAGARSATRAVPAPETSWLLREAFRPNAVTSVVLPDSGFGLMQGLLGRSLSLEDYLRPGYPESVAGPRVSAGQMQLVRAISERPYTTMGGTLVVSHLSALAERAGWHYRIRHARELSARDLAGGNAVLLGSVMSNPWVGLFEKQLEFEASWDQAAQVASFRSRDTGDVYSSGGGNGVPGQAFAVVSLLVSRDARGAESRVLILEGTNMEATESAWRFASDPKQADSVRPATPLSPSFQMDILLETRALAGTPSGAKVRSVRVR